MDFIEKMNTALSYIENNLDNKIDYNTIYKIACMSKSSFQNTFSFITDMTLGEYIKKLRLYRAVKDLVETDIKIIDIAENYSYDSAAAFSRAFKGTFGQTPSYVRKNKIHYSFIPVRFQIGLKKGEMTMNDKPIVRIEEHKNEKVICFEVDCFDAEAEAWKLMSEWCKEHISDRTARRYIGVAPKGHHPAGEQHMDAEEHVKHPYQAMMLLIGDEAKQDTLYGQKVIDAPQGLFLVNEVILNQYDAKGNLDMALSMMKASDAFVEFVNNTKEYEFDMAKGIFYEEHIFSEQWFQNGGFPDAFKMWVPVIKTI